ATHPASLDSAALSRRLSELAGHEREVQVEFLLHLSEYDLRRAWLEEGFGSLWDYLTRALHYREGAAHRRIRAMRVLRRLPHLADAFRDGRLCLTTAALLEPIITEENAADLAARAAFKSKADVEHLVVSVQPRSAPQDGIRKVPQRREAPGAAPLLLSAPPSDVAPEVPSPALDAPAPARAPEARPIMRPIAADTYSLNVKIDADLKREIDQLTELLSHKIPTGELVAVLREAVHCAMEKHGKRRGAVEPSRKVNRKVSQERSATATAFKLRDPIPAEVRREVWKRDGGCCAWIGPDGRRCCSRWKLEVDHIHPAGLGGPSTIENCRLLCAAHNKLHAEQTFGRAHMARFRRANPGRVNSLPPGEVPTEPLSEPVRQPDLPLQPAATS
ncbi:MAG TPA: DUF222 domain-containing protein, partial [Anaeromyxobacteraceae bacterium]